MKHIHRAFTALLIAPVCIVWAEPRQWAGNAHFYDVVRAPGSISWEEANAAATAVGGYLATITSAAENVFVFNLVNDAAYWQDYSGPWLGGYQSPDTEQANANWRWVTGEAWVFTNWQTGQPNHSGGKLENKLQFGFAPFVSVWNDIQSVDPTPAYRPIAYVVEWDRDPFSPILEILNLQSSSQVELCWETATNHYYQLLYSIGSPTNQWAPLHSDWVTGNGKKHCEIDGIPNGSTSRFYRLLYTNGPPM